MNVPGFSARRHEQARSGRDRSPSASSTRLLASSARLSLHLRTTSQCNRLRDEQRVNDKLEPRQIGRGQPDAALAGCGRWSLHRRATASALIPRPRGRTVSVFRKFLAPKAAIIDSQRPGCRHRRQRPRWHPSSRAATRRRMRIPRHFRSPRCREKQVAELSSTECERRVEPIPELGSGPRGAACVGSDSRPHEAG